jgi:hypothetical protein
MSSHNLFRGSDPFLRVIARHGFAVVNRNLCCGLQCAAGVAEADPAIEGHADGAEQAECSKSKNG